MSKMLDSRFFRAGIWILLVFLIILVGTQISFIFQPLVIIFNTLFFPFLIAGFLFFLTHPLVDWLQGKKIPRWTAILFIYAAFFGLVALLAMLAGPVLQRETTRLINDVPAILGELRRILVSLQDNHLVYLLIEEEPQLLEKAADWLTGFLENIFALMVQNISSLIELAASVFIIMITIPFILFYMLKDGHHWPQLLFRYLPQEYAEDIKKTVQEMNKAISAYIQGIFVVCLFVGVLVYIGYMIIGLDYPLFLALFAMVTNVIPFLGPLIGTIPGVIVGALHSPVMMLKVIIVVVVVQQMESLLVSPQVMGRKLSISPLTVILLVLVASRMAGLLGMILALPAYVILKIIVNHSYGFISGNKLKT